MRVDKYLKVSRIVKRRAVCKELAERGRVLINDKVAKPGSEVKVGDVLIIQLSDRVLTIKIVDVKEYAGKDESGALYEVVAETWR